MFVCNACGLSPIPCTRVNPVVEVRCCERHACLSWTSSKMYVAGGGNLLTVADIPQPNQAHASGLAFEREALLPSQRPPRVPMIALQTASLAAALPPRLRKSKVFFSENGGRRPSSDWQKRSLRPITRWPSSPVCQK